MQMHHSWYKQQPNVGSIQFLPAPTYLGNARTVVSFALYLISRHMKNPVAQEALTSEGYIEGIFAYFCRPSMSWLQLRCVLRP